MTNKSITHKFVSAIADGTDATLVRPSNWNDDHNLWLGYRAVTGTTDTIANTDHLSVITYTNVASIAVSIAAPGGGNFPLGWQVRIRNIGASLLTLSGTGGATINGNASVTVRGGDSLDLHSTGGTNYVGVPIYGPSTAMEINIAGGRLTLSTGTPVLSATVSGATTIYYTPYLHQWVPLYDGTNMQMYDTGGELSQLLTDTTKSPAAAVASSNYDMFVWNDAGTMRCTRGPAWTSSTARGTGVGTTELVRIKGTYLNANAITNGPAAQRGTYVGSIRTNGSSTVDWIYLVDGAPPTAGSFGVWNMYNRRQVASAGGDTTNSWTYASTTVRQARGDTTYQASFISGLAEDNFDFMYNSRAASDGTNTPVIGIGYDSNTAFSGSYMNTGSTSQTNMQGRYSTTALGWHTASACERASGATSQTFGGAGSTANIFASQLFYLGMM